MFKSQLTEEEIWQAVDWLSNKLAQSDVPYKLYSVEPYCDPAGRYIALTVILRDNTNIASGSD